MVFLYKIIRWFKGLVIAINQEEFLVKSKLKKDYKTQTFSWIWHNRYRSFIQAQKLKYHPKLSPDTISKWKSNTLNRKWATPLFKFYIKCIHYNCNVKLDVDLFDNLTMCVLSGYLTMSLSACQLVLNDGHVNIIILILQSAMFSFQGDYNIKPSSVIITENPVFSATLFKHDQLLIGIVMLRIGT